ncbi:MAG: CHAD domain-containing protein [Planctomycetes bacterium]|nr:CHAD domain-containing protein [Planctomycetota bacterium]
MIRPAEPVERKRSKLQAVGEDPAEGLALAFADMLSYAREQQETRDLTVAVHTFRKSVRRARSLVKLVRPSIPKAAYRELNDGLRRAVQATSDLRDGDVTEALLTDYEGPPGTAGTLAVWRGRLHAGERPAPEHVLDTLRACAEALGPIPARFAAVVANLTPAAFSAGFAESYRRARVARRDAIHHALQSEAVHTWRKRVKEVRYQLELLTSPAATQLNQAFGDLAQDLGRVTDWTVLGASVEQTEGLDAEARALLKDDFSARHHADARAVAGASAWLFGLKPASYLEVLCVGLDYRSPFAAS